MTEHFITKQELIQDKIKCFKKGVKLTRSELLEIMFEYMRGRAPKEEC